jgi:hypothetical protein
VKAARESSFEKCVRPESLAHLNNEFDFTIFDHDIVCFNRRVVRQALSCANVEAPVMPVAFDDVIAELTVGERRAFVRAKFSVA